MTQADTSAWARRPVPLSFGTGRRHLRAKTIFSKLVNLIANNDESHLIAGMVGRLRAGNV
jgi:hypothetical protein